MIAKIIFAFCLVAGTVAIHATGLTILLGSLMRSVSKYTDARLRRITWRIILFAWWLIVIHMIEIAVWGLFYWWRDCLPDAASALYFSGVTYTTVGYGDLVLPMEWRLFGPIEGLTGILMCGLSTASFFAVVSRLYKERIMAAED